MLVEARKSNRLVWAGDSLQPLLAERLRYRELRGRASDALSLAIGHQDPLLEDCRVTDAIRTSSRDFHLLERSTIEHQWRTAELAGGIGARLGLPIGQLRFLTTAATLHDVGKLFVPVGLLRRPGPLTTEEYEVVQAHSEGGQNWLVAHNVPSPIPAIVRSHHERWDGLGYPDRLSGDQIPFASRILGLADALDAMVSLRPYHCGRSIDEVRSIIEGESGRAFDPDVVVAALSFWD